MQVSSHIFVNDLHSAPEYAEVDGIKNINDGGGDDLNGTRDDDATCMTSATCSGSFFDPHPSCHCQIRARLRDVAVRLVRASCYNWAALSSSHSGIRCYQISSGNPPVCARHIRMGCPFSLRFPLLQSVGLPFLIQDQAGPTTAACTTKLLMGLSSNLN